jgi:hypothetical protein
MVEIIFAGISGLSVGIYVGINYTNYIISQKISKELDIKNKAVKDTFDDIFSHMNEIKFSKRVNNYVYLAYIDIDILIDLKKNMIYLSKGQQFLTDSRYLDANHSNRLLSDINTRFYNDINDIITFGENIISKNLASIAFEPIDDTLYEDEDENELVFEDIKYNVDSLLDKISAFGISSLSKEEMEFLKNQGN